MEFQTISLDVIESTAWLRMQRESQMNSLNLQMVGELNQALSYIESETDCRVLVLTGSGGAFCAGADLKEILVGLESDVSEDLNLLQQIVSLFNTLRGFHLPVIGALNGITMAGGLELALCCDFLVAAQSARIGDAHSNFGVIPGGGGAAVLPERIGLANAKYLLFTGDALSAARCHELGLVQEVVNDDALEARLEALASQLAAKSPLSLRRMKHIANASGDLSEVDALTLELDELQHHLQSDDVREGLAAFREKRKPVFTGT